MGRGRQKAKATRQAREMKYFSPETDYSALERELSSAKKTKSSDSSRRRYDDEDDYSAYAEKYASYEEEAKRIRGMIRWITTERIRQMMNRLETPHGVLSRFFRARSLFRAPPQFVHACSLCGCTRM